MVKKEVKEITCWNKKKQYRLGEKEIGAEGEKKREKRVSERKKK